MLLYYCRAALANLALHKKTTLINVVGLTLGFTCFTLGYVFVEYLGAADRQFANVERIYVIQQRISARAEDSDAPYLSASLRLASFLRAEIPELPAVARRTERGARVEVGERRFPVAVAFADPELLAIYDFEFLAGDPVHALDEPNAALVTDRMAELLFGTRDVMGEVFTIGAQIGREVDVIVRGVVAESDALATTRFPTEAFGILTNIAAREGIAPVGTSPADADEWSNEELSDATYVLLPADGSLSVAELDERLRAIAQRIDLPSGEVVSFRARHVSRYISDQVTAAMGILNLVQGLGAVTLFFLPAVVILGMACFNYTNLAAAIAATRAKEVGMTKVLGARSREIVQQHLFEAVISVAAAFVFAAVIAALVVNIVNNLFGWSISLASLAEPKFALWAVGVVLVTAAASGGYPAWLIARFTPLAALRAGAKRAGPGTLRSVFIAVQFAAASVLLTAVLVMYEQNAAMRDEIRQLPADPYVQLQNNIAETPNVDPDLLVGALRAAPQIKAVTGAAAPAWVPTLDVDHYSRSPLGEAVPVEFANQPVYYDFFSAFDVALVAGRSFDRERDAIPRPGAPARARNAASGIVIERAAIAALGFANVHEAIGELVYRSSTVSGVPGALAHEIIGVVDQGPLKMITLGRINVYHLQSNDARLIIRLAPDDVPGALAHIESTWNDLVPDNPLRGVRFLDELLDENLTQLNLIATALLTLVVFGFLVAVAGIFGMALFVAERRRHEIGIRKSLGARSRDVLRQLAIEFGRPVLVGNIVAWPAAYLLSQIYVGMFLQRASFAVWPYLLGLVLTLGIAWLGVGGQALHAARLQPARVLRYE